MPKYNFSCEKCFDETEKFLSISDYLKLKSKEVKCEKCCEGRLLAQVKSVGCSVEKSSDQIIIESKEEIRKVVEKVKSGDSKAINDIYGDTLNPYKK